MTSWYQAWTKFQSSLLVWQDLIVSKTKKERPNRVSKKIKKVQWQYLCFSTKETVREKKWENKSGSWFIQMDISKNMRFILMARLRCKFVNISKRIILCTNVSKNYTKEGWKPFGSLQSFPWPLNIPSTNQ